MSGPATITGAEDYWSRYYAEEFRFGMGTEDILDALQRIPVVETWVDLGAGSESLLWAIALNARRLIAVDIDRRRLAILREFAGTARPRGVHRAALALCGRTSPLDFRVRCRSLVATAQADCLTGHPPTLTSTLAPTLGPDGVLGGVPVELVTQFGLLGLCRDQAHLTTCFAALHRMLTPGGWAAGANWVAHEARARVPLTTGLYRRAAAAAGVRLSLLRRVPITGDPDFTAVWIYLGRTNAHHPHTR